MKKILEIFAKGARNLRAVPILRGYSLGGKIVDRS
jgi:hypothetical protein